MAVGKTRVAVALQRWLDGAAVLVPSNLLQAQYTSEFPEIPTLWRRSLYHCDTYDADCKEVRKVREHGCKGCICNAAVRQAKSARSLVVNYYTYLAHQLWRPVVIVDEAHQLLGAIQDLSARKLWWRDYKWPNTIQTLGDLAAWIESIPEPKRDEKLKLLESEIKSLSPATLVHMTVESLRGVDERVLKLIPIDTENATPFFWHGTTKKIILMSATISEDDIRQMGLAGRKVAYVECDSPIPPTSRLIHFEPVGSLAAKNQEAALPVLLDKLRALAAANPGSKGLVHAPYSLAAKIREQWTDSRVLFHNRGDKMEVYEKFRAAPPESGTILVASGMYEGVDLPYDAGRWQAICKVPFPNLGDPGIRAQMEKDQDWYSWQAMRDLLQASGRICRTPDDYGFTFILDSGFERLYKQNRGMVPLWFRTALVGI